MEGFDKSKYLGRFTIADRQITGELTLAGLQSSLYVWSFDQNLWGIGTGLSCRSRGSDVIWGDLDDLTRVSLIQCTMREGPGHRWRRSHSESVYHASIFPHYIIFGEQILSPAEETIDRIEFSIDDGNALFFDSEVFGQLIDARELIEQVVQRQKEQIMKYTEKPEGHSVEDPESALRETEIGPDPQIAYFTGKWEVFSTDTSIGKVAAYRSTSSSLGDPEGVSIRNKVWLRVEFASPVCFEEAIERMYTVIGSLELIAGRPQNLTGIRFRLKDQEASTESFRVYACGAPQYERNPHEGGGLNYRDALVTIARSSGEFSGILNRWIERNPSWRSARAQFFSNFRQSGYDPNRLVSAANMFDVLPDIALPPRVELTQDVKGIRDQCKNILRKLPDGVETSTVLSDLHRLGALTLKKKIQYRSQRILDLSKWDLPSLSEVTDEAVNCRNHYVHGVHRKVDYDKPGVLVFLTQTLEFVFAVSDLLEVGWNVDPNVA